MEKQRFASQLEQATSPDGAVNLKVLEDLVVDVYEHAERDRRSADQAIRLMAMELEEATAKLERAAHRDPLTDLPNRLAFNERLTAAIDEANAGNAQFAIICVDFDRFKEVNSIFGLAAADTACAPRRNGGLTGHFAAAGVSA
jgi:PleD family two-component response regulator